MRRACKLAETSRCCSLLLVIIALFFASPAYASTSTPPKSVLLLHSYHPGLTWTDDITAAVKQTLAAANQNISLQVEYLDTKRQRHPDYVGTYLEQFMGFKLTNLKFDLVIVADNDAFNFALKHKNDLFKDRPIIFCGVNGFEPAQIEGLSGITGVAEIPDLTATLQLIEKLHPAATELIVIGTTQDATGLENYEHFRRIEPFFPRLTFKYHNDFTLDDLLPQLKKLGPGQIIFSSPTIRDKNGRFYDFAEATRLLHTASAVPIYAGWDFFLGHGIVGGKLISGRVQGAEAAKLALKVLQGVDPSSLTVVSSIGSAYLFDYNELKIHQISLAQLPAAAQLINQPVSFYSVNKKIVWSSLIVTALLLILSAGLILLYRRQRELEKNLKTSVLRFKDIALNIGDWIWETDATGTYTYCSSKVTDLLGYQVAEVLGKSAYAFMEPESKATAIEFMQKIVAKKQSFRDLENWNLHKNGQRVCLLTSGTPVFADDGLLIGYRGVDKNVTAQRAAEARNLRRQAEFEAIFNSITDAIVFVDAQRRILRINPSFSKMFGYSFAEVSGQTTQLIYANAADYVTQGHKFFQPTTTAEPPIFENEYQRKDRSIFWAECLAARVVNRNHEPLGFLAVIRDISRRKQAEQERALLNSAIAQLTETIVITDARGSIQYVNPAFEKITGYTAAEVIGQNPRMLQSGEHDQVFYRQLWDKLATGTSWSGNFINKKKDGSLYTEEATISAVVDPAGTITHYVAVKRDITEQIAFEKQLLQTQKLEIVGTLASGIAHDFNNILTPIIGYTNLLQEVPGREVLDYERLAVISASAQRAKELVEQILNFSRLATEDQHPVSLKEQIEETATLLRASFPASIELSFDLQNVLVLATPAKIHQVLLNLCANAAQAMKKTGGRIAIELEPVALTAENPTNLPTGRYARLSIRDNGPGIAPEHLPRIFDPYFTTKAVGEGSGIGLATVQRIINALGGAIRAETQPDQGATFHVLLPELADAALPGNAVTPLILPGGNKHLLLVDDEELLIQISREFLQGLGYQVTGFTRAQEALAAFKRAPDNFDLLITDLTMPELSGIELAQRVYQIRPELPVILCTGQQFLLTQQECLEMNLLTTLQKPDLFAKLAFSLHQYFTD